MKSKKKRFNNRIMIVLFVVLICAGYAGQRIYQKYRDYALMQKEMAGSYDYEAMVKRYQEYPDSVLVKSDQPRVAFNEAYHSPDGFYYLSPVYKHDKSELKKPTPTKLADIQWYRYGFTSDEQKIYFSFDFPEHGIYCEGCFDGWPYNNLVANATGQWITGGYYHDRIKPYPNGLPRLWSLTAGVVMRDPKLFFVSTDLAFPAEKDVSLEATVTSLINTTVGESVEISDRYGQSKIIVKRQADISCGTFTCLYFKTVGDESAEYALLDKKTYVVLFTYEHINPVFDVFKRIAGSYTEGIDPAITHGRFPRVTSLEGYEIIPE